MMMFADYSFGGMCVYVCVYAERERDSICSKMVTLGEPR